jgi:hypothetical protein
MAHKTYSENCTMFLKKLLLFKDTKYGDHYERGREEGVILNQSLNCLVYTASVAD